MTPNERKILKYLWDAEGRAHARMISENVGITADYTRLLCRSLARAGYLKFADANVCYLLTKGRNRFQRVVLASSASISAGDGNNRDASEDVEEESSGQVVNDSDFDRVLADLNLASPQGEEGKEEESLSVPEPEEKAQAAAISEETPQAVLDPATTFPEKTGEDEEKKKAESLEIDKKIEAKSTDPEAKQFSHNKLYTVQTRYTAGNPASSAALLPICRSHRPAESSGEAQVGEGGEISEKTAQKEKPVKPSGGFGTSFKKIFNWFI